MKKPLILTLIFAPLLAVMPLTLLAQDMPPALVVTEPVKMVEFNDQLTLIGRSDARARSRIVAEVSGRVLAIDAEEGVRIAKGSRLVTIDSKRIQLSLRAKEAEAAQAKADADLADRELARAEDLFKQDILPERTLDDVRTTAVRAVERFNQLDAERRQLELDVARCVIRVPYNGFTVSKMVDVGEWVNPGAPVYETVDLSVVKVTVDLPERYFGQVEIGSPVSVLVSGKTSQPITGTVAGIAPQASEATHTFPLIVTVANEGEHLGGGMLVKATVSLKKRFSSLAVSKDAIIRQGGQVMVYTIIEGKAAPIMVRTSSSNGTMVAVEGEGLTEGMPVVVRGNERIFPGSPVQAANAEEENSEKPAEGTSPASSN